MSAFEIPPSEKLNPNPGLRPGDLALRRDDRIPHQGRAARTWRLGRRRNLVRVIPLVVADQVALLFAIAVAGLALRLPLPAVESWSSSLAIFLLLPLSLFLSFFTTGLYRTSSDEPGLEQRRITLTLGTLFSVAFAVHLAHASQPIVGWFLVVTLVVSLFAVGAFRMVLRRIWARFDWSHQRVLVLGKQDEGRAVFYWLRRKKELGFKPVGIVEENCPAGVIEQIGQELRADHLVVTSAAASKPDVLRRLQESFLGFEQVTIIPRVASFATIGADHRLMGSSWGVSIRRPQDEFFRILNKRVQDYVLGTVIFLASAPVIAILALGVRIVSPGSPFFRQRRVGLDGRHFDVYKLRTMRPDAEACLERYLEENAEAREEWEKHLKLKNDPRLLPYIGSFLRRTSLDELPQILNVLRGEMSLVGPRPLPPYHISKLPVEFCQRRQNVLPGLTGVWQVNDRANGDLEAMVRLDDYYLRNWSVWLDLRILAATLWAVVHGRGAR